MPKINETGLLELKNGYWGFRYTITVNGKKVDRKKVVDDDGQPFKTKSSAYYARIACIEREKELAKQNHSTHIVKVTFEQVYNEYCSNSRNGKAYSTIKKQDSLWNNHLKSRYADRLIQSLTIAEINDYLEFLYYKESRAYSYVESFLKMFYLLFGQAYARNYLEAAEYDKLCQNKATKIKMPKRKIDDEDDIVIFEKNELKILNEYFANTNAQTAYMIGKCCGLRISECYGIRWSDIDFKNNIIHIHQQLQSQNGLYKLAVLKTRNAKRDVVMSKQLKKYLLALKAQVDVATVELADQRLQNQTIITDLKGNKFSSTELVNCALNGTLTTFNSMKYHTRMLKEKHGIEFKFHYLRHTYATNLALLNTPIHILCNQLGHSSSNVTQQYYLGQSKIGIEILKKNLEKIS